jgi:hypothetical protein
MCLNVDLEEKFSLKKTKLSPKKSPLWRGIKGEDFEELTSMQERIKKIHY